MRILSLDPSLTAFGWAMVDQDLIDCGCIETKAIEGSIVTDSDTIRLNTIATALKSIIEKYQPEIIIFENPVGSKSSRANQALSFVKGLVVSACIFSNIQYGTVKAKTIKKKLTGKSDGGKDKILEAVKNHFSNFSTITKGWNKVKTYAASDAAAIYIGYFGNKISTVSSTV